MLNSAIVIKMKQRLNKLDSQDYDNIECWQVVESFNKAQVEWSRRQLHGINLTKEGDEQSTRRKDDLQVLLNTSDLTLADKAYYYRAPLPVDYLQWKRVDVYAKKGCCDKRRMTVYLAEEGNLNQLLRDKSKQPSFEWAETFTTMYFDRFKVYTNDKFKVTKAVLYYYRKPADISFDGCVNPSTGQSSTEQICELRDDVVEIIIDEAVAILAGDMDNFNQYQRNLQNGQRNS